VFTEKVDSAQMARGRRPAGRRPPSEGASAARASCWEKSEAGLAKGVRETSETPDGAADGDTRIAADPVAVVLAAMAVLGVVASIAAVNWMAEERSPDRARAKRKAGAAVKDLERCCVGLQELFKRLHQSPKLFAGKGSSSASSPLKFGVHGPRVGAKDMRLLQQSTQDVASMMVLATQNALDVMAAIEDGEISPPEELFYGFGEAQEKLNRLLSDRVTLKETVDRATMVAVDLTRLVQQLKDHRVA
jgi:hypothetical protein